jgi:hypothetical protein
MASAALFRCCRLPPHHPPPAAQVCRYWAAAVYRGSLFLLSETTAFLVSVCRTKGPLLGSH